MADYLVDLEDGEHVVEEVRRHMFVFYTKIIPLFILLVLPIFVSKWFVQFINTQRGSGGIMLYLFLYTLWILAIWVAFYFRWTDYYLDVWVITNRRVFDVMQDGMFSRRISIFRYEHIQDVNVSVPGIIATFLQYGDLHVHTAGHEHFVIKTARKPMHIKKIMMDQHGQALSKLGGLPPIQQRKNDPTQNSKN